MVKNKFLWFPKRLNGKTKWLKMATWTETFKPIIRFTIGGQGVVDFEVHSDWVEDGN